jgi:hypothetical protein
MRVEASPCARTFEVWIALRWVKRPLIVAVLLMLLAPAANAENAPDPRLDGAASEVGGHAVSVWCEADPINWMQLVRNAFQDDTMDASRVRGFNIRGSTVVYLRPSVCLTLRSGLKDSAPNGMFRDRGTALVVFLFESLRQSVPDMAGGRADVSRGCARAALRDDAPRYTSEGDGHEDRLETGSREGWVTRRVRVRKLIPNPAPYYDGRAC